MATIKGFTAQCAIDMQNVFELIQEDPIYSVYKNILIATMNGNDETLCGVFGISNYLATRESLKENGFQVIKMDHNEEDFITFKISW